LLTNAYKYGTTNKNPEINFNFKVENGLISLSIKDNGIGIDSEKLANKTDSLGFKLVKTFTLKLKGELKIEGNTGTIIINIASKQNMHKDLKILIVEDEPLIAEDILGFLETAGFSNISIVYDYKSAALLLEQELVEIVLLDINLEGELNGMDVAKKINKEHHLPFIFITSYSDSATIKEVKELHPVGYIVKPFNGKEIPAVLELGYELFYTYMGKGSDFEIEKLNKFASEPLTQKEIEVLLCIAEGKNNKQAADSLFVSVNTIKTHLKNIFIKLDITSRSEAIVLLNKAKTK
jgi:DNA-binding NarL/FixJ family response regulator